MKLLFPDACWNPEAVSGALFLYFHDEKLTFTLHPSVSTYLTGADPFDFIRFVEGVNPDWRASYRSSLQATSEILEPLHGTGFNTVLMSYPRGSAAWESSDDLIASSELSRPDVTKIIDPFSASDELFAHIFFEKYLELYEGHRSTEELVQLGAKAATEGVPERAQVDWRALYEYSDALFRPAELEDLFTTAYIPTTGKSHASRRDDYFASSR